jgi:hypothetical protein
MRVVVTVAIISVAVGSWWFGVAGREAMWKKRTCLLKYSGQYRQLLLGLVWLSCAIGVSDEVKGHLRFSLVLEFHVRELKPWTSIGN